MPQGALATAALCLALTAGCHDPVLDVGAHLLVLDSGERDTGVAPTDAGRARDAQPDGPDDRDPWSEEGHACNPRFQCLENEHKQRCHPFYMVCVECLEDRDCQSNRCNEEQGRCKDAEKPRT
jgi:hypothetical protein